MCIEPCMSTHNTVFDTDINAIPHHQGEYFSTEISAAASAWELLTALENMPNIGTVSVEDNPDSVTLGTGTDATTAEWTVTFTSAVGAFPTLEVTLLHISAPSTSLGYWLSYWLDSKKLQ